MVVSTALYAKEAPPTGELAKTGDTHTLGASRPLGTPNNGCILNAEALDTKSPLYRLVHWDRTDRLVRWTYGDKSFVAYTEKLAKQAPGIFNWGSEYVLGIADVSQLGGGLAFGQDPRTHRSHQRGLDGDFLNLLVLRAGNKQKPLYQPWTSLVRKDQTGVNEVFSNNQKAFVKFLIAAGSPEEVDAIFVHARIKEALCKDPTLPFEIQNKIISWDGHDKHFHVRLRCPNPADSLCTDWGYRNDGQNGCGTNLQEAIYALTHPIKHPVKTKRLIPECAALFRKMGRPIAPMSSNNTISSTKTKKRTTG